MPESIKDADRELLFADIIKIIERTLNTNETKTTITEVICKSLGADRCFIVDYDKKSDKFLPINHEYLSSDKILSCIGEDVQKIVPNLIDIVKNGKPILVKDRKILSNKNKLNFEIEEKTFKKFNVNSILAMPLFYQKELLGVLSVHYIDENHQIGNSEINLIKEVANQTVLAIYLANLYEINQLQAEEAKLLRNLIEVIRSTINIEDMQKIIVREIAQALNADRCFIMEYNEELAAFLPVKTEYLLSPEAKSIIGFDLDKEVPELGESNKRNEDVIITDLDKYLIENNLYNTSIENHFRKYEVKSGFAISISYKNQLLGILAIHYLHKQGDFIEDKLEFVKTLASQLGIALNQAKLYQKEKIAIEREKMSRNIIEILRKSMDKTMIKKLFVKNIRKFLEADKVFFSEYDAETQTFLPIEKDAEDLSNYKEKSFLNYDWSKQEFSEYIQPLKEKQELNIFNWDNYIQENNRNKDFIDFFESANIKSSYNLPVLYYQNIIGFLSINFTDNAKLLSTEDIEKLRDLCTQLGIALYQARLFFDAKQCFFSKEALLEKVSQKIEPPIKNILYESTHLSENKIELDAQINNITNSCNLILNSMKKLHDDI